MSGRLREVERDEVRVRVDVVGGLGPLDAHRPITLGRDVRVIGDHVHAERERPLRDELADPPEAEDAERLLVQLDPGELRAFPLAARQRRVRLRQVAGEREQERHRVLCCGDHVRLGRVGDDDAAFRRRQDVDVVDPDAGPADGA